MNIKNIKIRLKNLNKKVLISSVVGVGVIISTSLTINIQANKIKSLKQNAEQLNTTIIDKDKNINMLNDKINAHVENEDKLNNEIDNLKQVTLKLQDEKLQLENQKKEMEESVTYNKTRNTYLEQRNNELKDEIKKNSNIVKTSTPLKIAVDIGHNASPDTGANSKYGNEDNLTKDVGASLINLLKEYGHEVITVKPNDPNTVNNSLRQRVEQANTKGADLFLSIHFNSSDNNKANGTEVYISDTQNAELKAVAQKIVDNFSDYGYKNRGVKTSNFYVLKNTTMPAMLIECAFLTNVEDMARYEADKIAENILDGIEEVF